MLSRSVLDRHGRLIGYARISTEEQGTDPQLDERHAAGRDAVCAEHASGADRARPVPARLLREISPGETLLVVRLDRLARSIRNLLAVIGMTVCGDRLRVPDDHGDVGNLARPVGHRIARHLSDDGHGGQFGKPRVGRCLHSCTVLSTRVPMLLVCRHGATPTHRQEMVRIRNERTGDGGRCASPANQSSTA
jgi:hypothetical protein